MASYGCSLDSSGTFGAGKNNLSTATETDTGTGGGSAGTLTGGETSASDSASADATGTPTTTTAADPTTSATTNAPDGQALLDIDPVGLDFAMIPAGTSVTQTIVLRNVGDAAATNLSSMGLAGAFALAGGNWPGTAGDCTMELAPGAECSVDLAFTPPVMGPYEGSFVVAFDDGQGPSVKEATLTGVAQGQTGNLIVNPDAEAGGSPPQGWAEAAGSNWNTSTAQARSPSQSFNPGDALPLTPQWLGQDVSVSDYAAAIDDGAVVTFSCWTLTQDADYTASRLDFLDGNGTVLDSHSWDWAAATDWAERQMSGSLPVGTRTIRVLLGGQLASQLFGNVAVYFDDVSLSLSYP